MDLVEEEHLALVEPGQDRGEVAGVLDGGAAGDPERAPHLGRDDHREGGLAEPGGPESSTWSGVRAAAPGGLEDQAELLADPLLADELVERPWGAARPRPPARRRSASAVGQRREVGRPRVPPRRSDGVVVGAPWSRPCSGCAARHAGAARRRPAAVGRPRPAGRPRRPPRRPRGPSSRGRAGAACSWSRHGRTARARRRRSPPTGRAEPVLELEQMRWAPFWPMPGTAVSVPTRHRRRPRGAGVGA